MCFVGFEFVEDKQQREGQRDETVFEVRSSSWLVLKDSHETFDRIDINNVVVVIDHEPEYMAETWQLRKTVLLYYEGDFIR